MICWRIHYAVRRERDGPWIHRISYVTGSTERVARDKLSTYLILRGDIVVTPDGFKIMSCKYDQSIQYLITNEYGK